jgi:hypothetical protein
MAIHIANRVCGLGLPPMVLSVIGTTRFLQKMDRTAYRDSDGKRDAEHSIWLG